MWFRPTLPVALLAATLFAPVAPARAAGADPPAVSFKRDVAPILLKQCQTCHGPEKDKGKYRVDTFDRLRTPGSNGDPAVTPGKPDASTVYSLLVVHIEADERMPQKADPLPAAQIETVKRWIEQGAAFDGPDPKAAVASYAEGSGEGAPAAYKRPVPVTALAFAPGGAELLASGYHEVTRWDARTGKLAGRIPLSVQRVQSIAVDEATGRIAVAGGTPGVSGELVLIEKDSAPRTLEKTPDLMLVARFSPDGALLAAGGSDGAVRVYDLETGKRLWRLEPHADWVTDLAFSPDGGRLVTASRDKSCRVFDVKTAVADATYPDHPEPVYAVAFAADGKTVFSAGRDRKLHGWAAADGKGTSVTGGFGGDVLRLARVGSTVWSVAGDGKLRAHAADRAIAPPPPATRPATKPTTQAAAARPAPPAKPPRVKLLDIEVSGEWVYAVAASEPAGLVAAGAHDGRVRVWSLDAGEPVTAFVAAPGLER